VIAARSVLVPDLNDGLRSDHPAVEHDHGCAQHVYVLGVAAGLGSGGTAVVFDLAPDPVRYVAAVRVLEPLLDPLPVAELA